jgi:uncharacterized protein involved in copper resistance
MVIVLALVTAPVQAAFALHARQSADEAAHCAGMHHAIHTNMPVSGTTSSPMVDGTGHGAGHGCDGTCCNGACVHAPVALTGAVQRISDAGAGALQSGMMHRFAGRAISPLFRPPIPLPS